MSKSNDLSVEELMIRAAAAQPVRLERLDAALSSFGVALGSVLSEQGRGNVVSWLQKTSYVTCGKAASGSSGLCVVAEARPWSGVFHVRVDPAVLGRLVNRLLPSGPDEENLETRRLSPIERRIGLRMLDRAVAALAEQLSGVRKLSGRALELKDTLEDIDIGLPHERCVVASFGLDLDGDVGTLEVLMPFALFGADIDLLSRPAGPSLIRESEGWRAELSRMITSADVTVTAVLGQGRVRLGEALDWKPGSKLDLDIDASQPVSISIGGRSAFRGVAGRRGTRSLAVKISEELKKEEAR
ncbi:FliM/FliN family flagellar motor switch protein [Roseibacterium sp. SDUM158016]|uniref:FliM/FliN family flagellar motor switch protein n=1 Tax=Roseicyclus sediminis TaxID=2980997 RepID=UPI0021D381AC|nr:FliM/FliN family flagellar motor switch protein [Roseibacterium sp. SDUM158016]MCU4654318.1 FliM/FliN family flagellar motor switch protein [Roseibacterium sp. SDUM158016]